MAEGTPKETTQQITIAATSRFPGFKFSPTDEELITYYLRKKLEGCDNSVEVIAEVEICRHEPWDLPGMSVIHSENEWFFFSGRGRKYPNGTQSRRATELGYWKATGKERIVRAGNQVIGTKRTLVFHKGRAPKGERTEWIMHEFCMVGKSPDSPIVCRLRRNTMFCFDDGPNRASSSQGPQSITSEENHTASDGDTEIPTNIGEEFVRTTSSYGSYSAEQVESTSESKQKLTDEAAVTASSTHPKDKDTDDGDNVDDYFADILKDDIIKLDETPIRNVPMDASSTHPKDKDTADGDNVDNYFADILKDDIIKLDETPIPNVPMDISLELRTLEPEQPKPLQVVYPSPFISLHGITTATMTSQRKAAWTEVEEPWNFPSEAKAGGSKEHSSDDKGEIPSFDWSPTFIFTTMVVGKTWTRRLISGAVFMILVAVVLVYTA